MTYSTHPFRPIVGNAQFCSDCPSGDSFGATHPWHAGHQPVDLSTVTLALTRVPSETLWAMLDSRRCQPLRAYGGGGLLTCTTHRRNAGEDGLCPVGRPQAVVGRDEFLQWAPQGGRTVIDSSDLGLGVGQWPEVLVVPGPAGDPVAMRPTQRDYLSDDLVSVTYGALVGGLSLVVAND